MDRSDFFAIPKAVIDQNDYFPIKSKTPDVNHRITRKGGFRTFVENLGLKTHEAVSEKSAAGQILHKTFKEKWNIDENAKNKDIFMLELDKEKNIKVQHS